MLGKHQGHNHVKVEKRVVTVEAESLKEFEKSSQSP